jgi:predicted solute-binding protein
MCLSCGCGEPNESHGNPDNITQDVLQRAADAANVSVVEAAANISSGAQS